MTQPLNRVIIYDQDCALCNFWVRFLLKYDHRSRFLFAGQHSEYYNKILPKLKRHSVDVSRGVVLVYGDTVLQGVDAVWGIFSHLGGGWRYLGVLRWVPLKLQLWLYDRIARNRYRLFGRHKGACLAGSRRYPGRFLL
jgi:predicted DCC family thiol-disulfide oxidoreductase YuxK